jgi:hypothetical protein
MEHKRFLTVLHAGFVELFGNNAKPVGSKQGDWFQRTKLLQLEYTDFIDTNNLQHECRKRQ